MKTIHRGLALLIFALLLGLPPTRALAVSVSEPPDFPNNAASAATYVLTSGFNSFAGFIQFNSGDADFFKFTVPAGMRLTQVAASGIGTNVPSAPQPAGTYTASCNPAPGTTSTDVSWSINLSVDPLPDYDITSSGGVITVTNISNSVDTLTVSQPSAGNIGFAASARTFSVNGAANTASTSSPISLSGVTAITVNGGSGGKTINVGAFSGSSFPSLTINGGAGNDTVNFNGNITFASGRNLTVNLQSSGSPGSDAINVTAAQLLVSGAGTIDLECSRSVSITGGAVLQTAANGNLTVMANQQATATTGNFTGVTVDGAGTRVQQAGGPGAAGVLTVKGRGGNDSGGFQLGVNVNGGAQIIGSSSSLSATVEVAGTGGASTGIVNRGVTVYGTGSVITSNSTLKVTGIAGTQGSGFGIGVSVLYGGRINGNFGIVVGSGGGASGGANHGVEIGGAATPASTIISDSNLDITATAGPGASVGLYMSDAATIGPAPVVNLGIDTLSLNDTTSITATAVNSGLYISTISAAHIDLGGAGAAGTLGLPDTLLDHLFTPTLSIGGSNGSDITISAPITRASKTDLFLRPNLGGVRAVANGTDLDLAGGKLYLEGPLIVPITGSTADTGFPQLRVLGDVSLEDFTNVPQTLNLAGTTYAGSAGDKFTIIANDGNAATAATFENLPEGAYLVWPGNSALAAKISYVGGTGNDVTLTLRPVAEALTVTNTASNSSPGSFLSVLAFAAAHPGADTITFDSSLNGQTITLTSEISTSDAASVTIDASALPLGLTLNGSGNHRLFTTNSGTTSVFTGITFTGGYAFVDYGGAFSNTGNLTFNRCTLSGNGAPGGGGAILNYVGGTLTLTQCTLSGNSALGRGGAIQNWSGHLTMTHCTISGNDSNGGGGVDHFGDGSSLTMTNTIIAGNYAHFGFGPDFWNEAGSVTASRCLIEVSQDSGITNSNGNIVDVPALLAPLDNYGGPTKTMALQPGSPARNAAVGSSVPSDQRGFPIVGTPDIGAYEAGTTGTNYNAYIWETLPAGTTDTQHLTTSDYDGDGVSNFNEYLAQTNASLASSYLHITQFTFGSSVANITFPSVLGRHYNVEITTSLVPPVNWATVNASPLDGTGNPITFQDGLSGFNKIFFRVRVGP